MKWEEDDCFVVGSRTTADAIPRRMSNLEKAPPSSNEESEEYGPDVTTNDSLSLKVQYNILLGLMIETLKESVREGYPPNSLFLHVCWYLGHPVITKDKLCYCEHHGL